VRAAYRDNPDIDFHQMVQDLVLSLAGLSLGRDLTKNVNFGLVYGMAEATLRRYISLSEQQAEELFTAYHNGAPFIKRTYDHFAYVALCSHEVRTILKRRSRFNMFEPATAGMWGRPMPRLQAKAAYGHIKPAFTHKALNRVLQGSAADLMKQALVDMWESGVLDVVGVPHVTVHDELGFSDDGSPAHDAAFAEIEHMMEHAIALSVPVRVGVSRGTTWGDAK
jgi:DNA polymerase-1